MYKFKPTASLRMRNGPSSRSRESLDHLSASLSDCNLYKRMLWNHKCYLQLRWYLNQSSMIYLLPRAVFLRPSGLIGNFRCQNNTERTSHHRICHIIPFSAGYNIPNLVRVGPYKPRWSLFGQNRCNLDLRTLDECGLNILIILLEGRPFDRKKYLRVLVECRVGRWGFCVWMSMWVKVSKYAPCAYYRLYKDEFLEE